MKVKIKKANEPTWPHDEGAALLLGVALVLLVLHRPPHTRHHAHDGARLDVLAL